MFCANAVQPQRTLASISFTMRTQSDRYQSGGRRTFVLTTIILLVALVIDDVSSSSIRPSSSSSKWSKSKFDYCSAAGLCPAGTSHVACSGLKFGTDCQRPILIKMTPKYMNLILNYHNLKRNALACGTMKRFASASSMQKLRWNDELAHLAEYNAKSCQFAHDECHNTDRFRYTGQSIGMKWFHGMNYTSTYVVRDLLRKWYLEHKEAKQRDVDRYEVTPHSFRIGHFTQMIHADTTEIGCALVRFHKHANNLPFMHYYLVCNYSEGNVEDRPVYRKGKRCSKCKHGCTGGKFRCLCRG